MGNAQSFLNASRNSVPFILMRKVILDDCVPVTSLALIVPAKGSKRLQIAVGKASGSVFAIDIDREEEHFHEVYQPDKHSQTVTGVSWAFNGQCLYTCSQDNSLQAWKFTGDQLIALSFPEDLMAKIKTLEDSSALPNGALDGYYGLTISKGNLAIATVGRLSTEVLDPMYQSRAMKGIVQVYWIGGQPTNVMPTSDSVNRGKRGRVSLSDYQLAAWETHILEGVQYAMDVNNTLVLWDILSCLDNLSSIVKKECINLVISKLFGSLGLIKSHSEDGVFLCTSKDYKDRLSNVSCRCLQIGYVISKRMQRNVNRNSVTESDVLPSNGCADSEFDPQKRWSDFLDHVEKEIQERLVEFRLTSEILRIKRCIESCEAVNSDASCMILWAISNSSKVSREVVIKAQSLAQCLEGEVEDEYCSLCNAKMPFLSPDFGECEGNQPHRLPRCSVTFRVCPPDCQWYCHCCNRRASKQIPMAFFSLSSKHAIGQLEDTDELHEQLEPRCPYCGILMQRLLPDCLLRMWLT